MNITTSTHRTLSLAFAITGLFIFSNTAVAQQTTEEVVVSATVERAEVQNAYGMFVKTEITELESQVSIVDLDLSRQADVNKLDTRIADIAKESCQKLSDMFPLDRSDRKEMGHCVSTAIASTNEQVERAVRTAN